jgi:replicative DNA helicase
MAFDVELEKDVLAACLKDKKYLSRAAAVLEEKHFSSGTFAWVWKVLAETFTKHRELAGPSLMFARMDRDWDEDKHDHVEDVLAALYDRKPASPKAALSEIRRFIKMAVARRTADGVLDSLDDGDMDEAEAALDAGSTEIRRASLISEPSSWTAGAAARLARYESFAIPGTRRVFKTMSETINHRAIPLGGLPAGKIGEILATTNVGKTSFLVGLGYNAANRSGAAVLHITSEDEAEEVEKRYDACITGIDRDKLGMGKLTTAEKTAFMEAFDAHAHIEDRIFVQSLPKGHKVTMVGPLVEMVRERHPKLPILLCYDSPYHARGITVQRERRHELREVIEYVDNLTKDESLGLGPVGVWFTHHARKVDAGKVPTAESGAESYDIERTVDFAVGLREGDSLPTAKEKTMELWITKNRIGPLKKAVVYMKADLGTCRFREVAYHEVAEEEEDE